MQSRVEKSMKNTIFGMVGLFCSLVVSFIARSVFIRLLGVEYNGVNGLFTNILQVLSLAELGFATSIAYALYRPLKEQDEKTTAMLMRYFSKIYRMIALVVAAVGCCCIPFLQYLISEDISTLPFTLGELRIYFGLYLANTVCSYLLAYKRTIITADQNVYIVSNVDNISNVCLNLLQIGLLYLTKNFYAYLIILVVRTLVSNIIIHLIASKRYPYLKEYKADKLPKEERTSIFKNVQALFLHRIGGVVIFSTSSIVISAFVSLIDAGKYSNYTMILTNVNNFINIVFNSVTASIGNLCLGNDKEHQYVVFKRISYISNFFAVFTFVCYVCLFNDFITIWVGADMQFGLWTVVAISLNGMVSYIRKTVNAFKDGMGLFRQDWFKPLLEAGTGIALAIGLSYVWGTFGVILGYTLATIFIAIPVENIVLFKFGLKRNAAGHVLRLLGTTGLSFALTALTYFICTFIPDGIGWFILEFFFVVFFAAAVYLLLTCRTAEFKYYVGLAKQILRKVLRKKVAATSAVAAAGTENEDGSAEEQSDDRSERMEPSQKNDTARNADLPQTAEASQPVDLPQTDEASEPVPENAAQSGGAAEEEAGGAPDGKPQ